MKHILLFGIAILSIFKLSAQPKELKKLLKNGYALIPQKTKTDSVIVPFYLYKYEVSNFEYSQFLSYLKAKGDSVQLAIATIDTLKWNSGNWKNSKYAQYYHKHPAYRDYPLVNVSYEAANLFCVFIQDALHQKFPMYNFSCSLPSKEQLMKAAAQSEFSVYAWGNNTLQNAAGAYKCNFTHIGSENIHRNEENKLVVQLPVLSYSFDYSDVTAPVKSYWPNQFGVYNLNGNVAEMITEKGIALGGSWRDTGYDVQSASISNYTEPSTSVGFRFVLTFTPVLK